MSDVTQAFKELLISPQERSEIVAGRKICSDVILTGVPPEGGNTSRKMLKKIVETAFEGGAVNAFRAVRERLVESGDECSFDTRWLLEPNYEKMSQLQRLLRAVMLGYKKIHPMCRLEEMSEGQVSEVLMCEICNTIGDTAFQKWLDEWKEE